MTNPAIIRRKWTKQPSEKVKLDKGSSLVQGLSAVYLPGQSRKNLAKNVTDLNTTSGGPAFAASPYGPALNFTNDAIYTLTDPPITDAVGSSLMVLGRSASTEVDVHFSVVSNNSSAAAVLEVFNDASNISCFIRRAASGSSTSLTATRFTDWFLAIVVSRGQADHEFWLKNLATGAVTKVTDTTDLGASSTALAHTTIGGYRDTNLTNELTGDSVLAGAWDRALADGEIQALLQNPWQIFKPREIFIPKPRDRRLVVF